MMPFCGNPVAYSTFHLILSSILVKENQVKRENIIIIGVPSLQIVDQKKIYAHLGGKEVTKASLEDGTIHVEGDGFSEDLKIDDFLQTGCEPRDDIDATMFDIVIGDIPSPQQSVSEDELIKKIEGMTPQQRWEFFKKCSLYCKK